MAKTVAIQGDVQAEAGSVAVEADTDQAGSWSAGPVVDTVYDHLTVLISWPKEKNMKSG